MLQLCCGTVNWLSSGRVRRCEDHRRSIRAAGPGRRVGVLTGWDEGCPRRGIRRRSDSRLAILVLCREWARCAAATGPRAPLLLLSRVDSLRIKPNQLTQHSTEVTMPEDQSTDVPPNQLSIDPRSAFYDEEVLRRDVGIRFNGVEKTNIHEYNVAEGWVRLEVPTAKDRRGNPMIVKLNGTVEPYFREPK